MGYFFVGIRSDKGEILLQNKSWGPQMRNNTTIKNIALDEATADGQNISVHALGAVQVGIMGTSALGICRWLA